MSKNKLIFNKRRYNCVILCGCEEKVSLRKFVLLHQEFLPKKYEKVEKLIKSIVSDGLQTGNVDLLYKLIGSPPFPGSLVVSAVEPMYPV